MGKDVIIACDFAGKREALTFLDRFAEEKPYVKIGMEVGDQVRVTTPEKAKELGSDYIVVGRPITRAEDPVAVYRRCVREFVG